MQISDSGISKKQDRGSASRVRLALLKALVLLACLFLLNGVLSFLMEPYLGPSEEMWRNYRSCENLDTVFVGTSQCLQGINPATLDRICGSSSCNMATNMQSLANSRDAIAAAVRDHHIQNAVLVIDHEILDLDRSDNFRADQSYWHAKAITEPSVSARLLDDLTFMTSPAFFGKPASLTYLTPWVYNRSSSLSQNLKEKISGTILDTEGHRTARGFLPSAEELSPEFEFITWEEAEEWDKTAVSLKDLSISEGNKEELAGIRDLCAANQVSLTVIVVPYPNWLSIYPLENYLETDAEIASLFAEAGFEFYDFNLILPEYFDPSGNENYSDVGHMNERGAERFSAFFGEFLKARSSGEEVQTWFRTSPVSSDASE